MGKISTRPKTSTGIQLGNIGIHVIVILKRIGAFLLSLLLPDKNKPFQVSRVGSEGKFPSYLQKHVGEFSPDFFFFLKDLHSKGLEHRLEHIFTGLKSTGSMSISKPPSSEPSNKPLVESLIPQILCKNGNMDSFPTLQIAQKGNRK